jgi:hypothetical protein
MANITRVVSDASTVEATELERLGITMSTSTFFHWKGYRYTSARDALHAARRAERSAWFAANG